MTIEPHAAENGGPWQGWERDVIDGRYPLRQWVGSSDHSQVFLTEHRLGDAAIKLLPIDLVDAGTQLSHWQAAMALDHPHLIRLLDCGRCQAHGREHVFVVMEYAEETLAEILPLRALQPGEVESLLKPLLDAIAFLHERCWVHTRIQPSNIMVVGDQVKLSCDSAVPMPYRSAGARTSLYDPPDLESRRTAAGDIWATGITLIEALTQHAPLPGTGEDQPALPQDLPPPLAEFIRRCLQRSASQRPAAGVLWSELTGIVRPVPQPQRPPPPAQGNPAPSAPTPEPAVSPSSRSARRGVPIAIALGGLAAWFFLHRHAPAPQHEPRPPAAPAIPDAGAVSPGAATPAAPVAAVAQAPHPAPVAPAGGVRHEELPRVPDHAAATIHGRFNVVVRVSVNPNGEVSDSRFESAGPSAYFGRLSMNAARRWTFARAAEPARDWVITFQYSREGVTARAQPANDNGR